MGKPLRLLIIEDSEDDALLLVRELRRGGYLPEFRRVQDPEELGQALEESGWDLVITDHNMPGFDSSAALRLIKRHSPDLPVIIVSGSIGEEFAVAAMKAGAHDYLMKGNLKRLVPAIDRELRDAETRRARRRAEEEIRHLAFHDPLTGLFNRREFERRLERALVSGRETALLYLDLDQFKIINDTSGHVAGDELLRQLAHLFKSHIRAGDTLARLGGDEFGILLERCGEEQAERIAEKIRDAISGFRFVWKGKPFGIGVSIGLVMIGREHLSLDEALSRADMACYAAKDRGRNRVHRYADSDREIARRRNDMQWAARIRQGLEEGRFLLYRQEIRRLSGDLPPCRCYEYLLRLRGDDGEIIAPGAFIPAAEHYNLMSQLDRWVTETVFERLERHQPSAAGEEFHFINLSGNSLSDDAFFPFIRRQMEQRRIPPRCICFEITETSAIASLGRAIEFIHEIRALGCRFALDDFGTGLSSFSYLKTIPVDYLKIDGGFVRNMLAEPMDQAIVEAINRIGQVAGILTIAEFVEDEETLHRVKSLGIDYAQGFGIGLPEPLPDLE
ncbi:MAG TPA: GGDEF domain-containing response regulator [Sedimenticola thiotaurini]|uniref:GGDEF domain-containing response regulator n=1 Tax=Sedimenticola thiotaurini TaxID=1543721 RepID=A0A831W9D0_9GAMM|nr:GGDEF domain-containing response regulator [Sedimenticola thiotaurini]